jgi:hypothetical protein
MLARYFTSKESGMFTGPDGSLLVDPQAARRGEVAQVALRVFLVQVQWRDEPAPLLIEVAAIRPELASGPARLIATALWARRLGVVPQAEHVAVTSIEDLRRAVPGPYVIALTRKHRVPLIGFPDRIEAEGSANFEAVLNRLSQRECYGLIMDLSPMTFLTSRGLAALLRATLEGNLHCLLPKPAITRIFNMVGAANALRIHRDLASALTACL